MERGRNLHTDESSTIEMGKPKSIFGIDVLDRPKSLIPIKTSEITTKPEDYAWISLVNQLQNSVNEIVGVEDSSLKSPIQEPTRGIEADLAFATHPFSKIQKKSPDEITKESVSRFEKIKDRFPQIKSARQIGGYVNFDIDYSLFSDSVITEVEEMGDSYGDQNIGNGRNIVLDVSSPNIAKLMGVGHLRSTVIGESLARIYRSLGYTTIRDNHIGDWGTQFGMLGAAYEKWGDEYPELKSANENEIVKGLYKIYVRMHSEIEKEKVAKAESENIERGRDKGKKVDVESSLEKEGKKWFQRLESGDPKAKEMWKWALDISLKDFERIYEILGVEFEYMIGESFYTPMLSNVVRSLLENNVATRDEEGTVIITFDDKGENKLRYQKSDGTSLYATRDIAGLAARTLWFDPEKILYVVGGEQKHYFNQVFETFKRLAGGKEIPELKHVYFGMLTLPEGKMSTRKGNVIFLEELLQKAIDTAKAKILENNPEMPIEEIDEIARKVGVGAIVYFDLGQGRKRDIVFDWDTALSFEGNGAPYIQYAYTRARAIIEKANTEGVQINKDELKLESDEEIKLVKQIAKLPQVIQKAIDDDNPTVIAEFAYNTASLFNQFYKNNRVLNAETEVQKNSRLRLTNAAAITIKKALYLLGIQTPERM